jgi:DNA (cytosine-5)-methyltransferase 1
MSAQIADTNTQNEYLDILDEAWQQHLAPRAENAPTVISTFAGCGGSSLGYSMAGFRELLAVEWDDNAVETFKLNFPGVPVYHGDIAKLSVEECLQLTGLQPGELDIFDGSPPCQGFSTAGKRQLDDDRNQLFREYVRLLRGLRPKVFVMENVSGMVKGKMKLIFAEVMRELKASGYRVKCQLMNAMYFNVPQSRQRLIFIGVRDDIEIEPSHPKAERRQTIITLSGTRKNKHLLSEHEKQTSIKHKIRHKAKGNGFGYVELKHSECAPTWPKTLMRSSSCPRFICGNNHWLPSEQELNTIGSYPLQYKFSGSYKQQWQCIGNSVPPLFMRSIARHIRAVILDKPKHDSMRQTR